MLPETPITVNCPKCRAGWQLTSEEARLKTFTCTDCNTTFGIIDILNIENAWKVAEDFPRPDWKCIREYIQQNYLPSEHPALWHQAAMQWVRAIRYILGGDYRISQSPNFIVLTTKTPESAKYVLQVCENAIRKIRDLLGDLAWRWTNGKHVIFMFEDVDLYYRYISYFYAPEGEFSQSGGMFLSRGYSHTALPPTRDYVPTIIHELTHLSLRHLQIPLWLNEGLAMNTENAVIGRSGIRLDGDLAASHETYWNAETIQDFWSGKSFSHPDASKLSYSLAQALFANMQTDCGDLHDFIKDAKPSDAGESSAKTHLGVTLNEVAASFLGEGDWTPRPPQPVPDKPTPQSPEPSTA